MTVSPIPGSFGADADSRRGPSLRSSCAHCAVLLDAATLLDNEADERDAVMTRDTKVPGLRAAALILRAHTCAD